MGQSNSRVRQHPRSLETPETSPNDDSANATAQTPVASSAQQGRPRTSSVPKRILGALSPSKPKRSRARTVSTPAPATAPLAVAEEDSPRPRPRRESQSVPKRRGWRLSRRFSKAPEHAEDAMHAEEGDTAVREQEEEEHAGEMEERIMEVDKRVALPGEQEGAEQAGEASGSSTVPELVEELDRHRDLPQLPPAAEAQESADAVVMSIGRDQMFGEGVDQDEVVIQPPLLESESPQVESMLDAPPASLSQSLPENRPHAAHQHQHQIQQQQQPQRFPPPGALVVVQGVVHTTDVSRPANANAPTSSAATTAQASPSATSSRLAPPLPSYQRRRALSTPRPSTLSPSSGGDRRMRDRLSAAISRPPRSATPRPLSMLPSIPSSASASTSNEPFSSTSGSPWSSSDASSSDSPSRGDSGRPSIDEPAGSNGNDESQGSSAALTPSSIDVLGTLLSVAAAATAASLLTGSSEPIFSTGLTNSAPNVNGNQPASPPSPASPFTPASPPSPFSPTTSQNDASPARDRMRHVWSSLRDRLGLRNGSGRTDGGSSAPGGNTGAGGAGEHTRPDGTPMDAREIMLAEMARAFNLGLGINNTNANANANGTGNSGAVSSSSRHRPRDGRREPQLGGGSVQGGGEGESHREDGEAGEARGGDDDLPPPDSFERFLIDLQADLRVALSHVPGSGAESSGSGSDAEAEAGANGGADRSDRDSRAGDEPREQSIPNVTVTAPEANDQESELEVYDSAAEDLDMPSSPTFSRSVPLQGNERDQLRASSADDDFADMPPLSSFTDSSDEDSLDERSHTSQSQGGHEATPHAPRGQHASDDHTPTAMASTSRDEPRHEAASAGRRATNANANSNRNNGVPVGTAGVAAGTPGSTSRTEHRPGGGINWWRMYRFPAITSQQVQAHHGQSQTSNQNQTPNHQTAGGHALSSTAGRAQTHQVESQPQGREDRGHATASVATQNPSVVGGSDANLPSATAAQSSVSPVPPASGLSLGMSTAAAQSRPQSLAHPRSIPNLDTGASSVAMNPSTMSPVPSSSSPLTSTTPHFPSPSTPISSFSPSTSAMSAEGPLSPSTPSTIPAISTATTGTDQQGAPSQPNVVVPVIVVGLQSVSMDRHHRHAHAHAHPSTRPHGARQQQTRDAEPFTSMEHDPMDVDPFGGAQNSAHTPHGEGAEDEDTNMDIDPDIFGDVDEYGFEQEHGHDRASRGRSWGSRAANAFRSLRSGASASGSGANQARRAASQPRADAPGSRTFLIYVIGGYYPPDHQIITGGNLDSFEALWELAELLGQVKPQTASKDEIEKSGLEIIKASLLKQYEEEQKVTSNCVERCLICLDDYVPDDDVRVLTCRHAFHQGCVDRWLEIGKNNCPACRSKGVGGDGSVPHSPTSPTTAFA